MASNAFYEQLDDTTYLSTLWTNGPWAKGSQHGGPPSALMARALELTEPRDDMIFGRVTCEILGPVPVSELEITSRVSRAGKRVEMVDALMTAAGEEIMRARGWRIARDTAITVPSRDRQAPELPAPEHDVFAGHRAAPGELSRYGWWDGYLSAMEWRAEDKGLLFDEPGPAKYWARMRIPLVSGEEVSGLQRLLITADSGNGISAELDISKWFFINPELTVHLHREPIGEWVCLDAETAISEGGCGLATSILSDLSGPVARGAQSLLVSQR